MRTRLTTTFSHDTHIQRFLETEVTRLKLPGITRLMHHILYGYAQEVAKKNPYANAIIARHVLRLQDEKLRQEALKEMEAER